MKKVVIAIVIILTILAIGAIGYLHKDSIISFVQNNILKTENNEDIIENTAPIRTGDAPPYIAYFDEGKNARVEGYSIGR